MNEWQTWWNLSYFFCHITNLQILLLIFCVHLIKISFYVQRNYNVKIIFLFKLKQLFWFVQYSYCIKYYLPSKLWLFFLLNSRRSTENSGRVHGHVNGRSQRPRHGTVPFAQRQRKHQFLGIHREAQHYGPQTSAAAASHLGKIPAKTVSGLGSLQFRRGKPEGVRRKPRWQQRYGKAFGDEFQWFAGEKSCFWNDFGEIWNCYWKWGIDYLVRRYSCAGSLIWQ